MAALIWLGIALLLVFGEMFIGDLSMLMLASGALAAAGISVADVPLWLQVVVFAVVTITMIATVRPVLRKKMSSVAYREVESGPQALTGRIATVVEPISSRSGMIRVNGELWSARPLVPGADLAEGEDVTVISIDGNTAVVDKHL